MENTKLPLAYFITFTTYGARLHGELKNTVDIYNNKFGKKYLNYNSVREKISKSKMINSAFLLDNYSREIVLQTIVEVSNFYNWNLFAAHIRSNHAHCIVQANVAPELIMNKFKSYSTRRLKETGKFDDRKKFWARHGSTRFLWDIKDIQNVIYYILHEQGTPMACYDAEKITIKI